MGNHYDALQKHLGKLVDLGSTMALLGWDQQTQMPPGGAESRARQMATVSGLWHEMFTGEKTAQLLEAAEADINGAEYASNEASLLRVLKHDYEEQTRLPSDFVSEWAKQTTLAHNIWAEAREKDDFSLFEPVLGKLIDMAHQRAEYLGYEDHPYDALLGQFERGMKSADVKHIFDSHRPGLVELIQAVSEAEQVDDSVLHQDFDIDKQRDFALDMIKHYGFDFNRGVQAVAVHPFCTNFSVNDVRITTRFSKDFLNPALFGMMHEAGHGMYEQGSSQDLEGTWLAGGTSLAVHESQSRLWENIVGRSKGFWSWALPQLKQVFPDQLNGVDLDTFYKAINKVEPSLIRVEADEATYNLHIMVRFELEMAIFNHEIKLQDIPEAWNSRYHDYLGVTPPNNQLGVLQDVHWSMGSIGYFATYALGNLLSAQYYNKALEAYPSIPDEIASGKFDTLYGWLRDNIYTHGRKFTADELTQRITGESIQSDDYLRYLKTKFSGVYGL